jgi:flagellar biosynthesis chaperone FliJ
LEQARNELEQARNELEQARTGTRGALQQELKQVKAEREFYCKRVVELEEQNRVLSEAATKYSL